MTPDATIAAIDGAIADATSPDAVRWVPPEKRWQREQDELAKLLAAYRSMSEVITKAAEQYRELWRIVITLYRRSGPPPLAVDGAAYHRRQRARVRRRR